MTDKTVHKALLTIILYLQLVKVWADKRYHSKYNDAIELLDNAIKEDYSKDLLFLLFIRLEVIMSRPLPLNRKLISGSGIIGDTSEEIIIPKR